MSVNGSTVSPCGQTNPEMLEQCLHKENAQRIQMLSALSQTRLHRAALLLITAAWLHPSFNPLPSLPCLLKHLHCRSPHTPSSRPPQAFLCAVPSHLPPKEIKSCQFHNHFPHWSYNPNVIHSWKRHHLPFYPIPKQCPHCLQGSGHWPCPLLLDPLFSMGASTPTTWLVHCLSSFCNSGLRTHANFWKLWR